MLDMKIDLLLEKFEDYSQDKAQLQTLQALETRMTCEVCGNVGHSGDNCPETQEEALFLNGSNGFHPQGGQGMSQSDFLINNLICPTLLGTSKGQLGGSC